MRQPGCARNATGYDALLNSALKGKNAMGPQGGGDFSDVEIGRAVVYMANAGGAKFEEPSSSCGTGSRCGCGASVRRG